MKPDISRYLREAKGGVDPHEARAYAQQHTMSANGDRQFGADGWVDDSLYFTDDINPGEFYRQADGAAVAADPMGTSSMPASQPYVLQVSNASANTVTGVTIWQANTYLGNFSNWTNGSYTANGVTISCVIGPAVNTYQAVLWQSQSTPFTVGKTFLSSISGSQSQVFQPLQLTTYDANGNFSGKTIVSPLPPTQFQAGVYINPTPYRIDQYTGVSITVLPSVVFQIYFYPSFNINLARGLGNSPIGRGFGNKPISQPTVAVLK